MRNFDTAHPGCHFEEVADAPDLDTREVMEVVTINPSLSFLDIKHK